MGRQYDRFSSQGRETWDAAPYASPKGMVWAGSGRAISLPRSKQVRRSSFHSPRYRLTRGPNHAAKF